MDSIRIGHGRDFIAAVSLVLIVAHCVSTNMTMAQERRTKPTVRVSMYYAAETDVCRPDGYSDSSNDAKSKCERLDFDRLEVMRRDGVAVSVQNQIPPEELRLGSDLLDSIDAFTDECSPTNPCSNPSRRYSLILAFDVDIASPETYAITIHRTPPEESPFDPYSNAGQLSPAGRWINHQRADVFLPSNRVRWQIEIGDWSWNLGTVE